MAIQGLGYQTTPQGNVSQENMNASHPVAGPGSTPQQQAAATATNNINNNVAQGQAQSAGFGITPAPVSASTPAPAAPTPSAPPASTFYPPTNPDNNLMVQGNREKFYGDTKDQYTTPSYTEQLVAQGMGGQLNDYYEFANNKLNDQFAAMGGGPSGALLRASQQLRANQAHDMMDYTKSADDVHYGRLGAGQNAASVADTGQLDRLKTAFGAAEGLGASEAGMTGGFYGNAASSSNPFTQEGINAGVQQSTIDPGSKFFGDAMNWAGTVYKGSQGGGK